MSFITDFAAKAYYRLSEEVVNIIESPTLKRLIGGQEEIPHNVPRMFAQAISALTYDDESDIDEIAPIIHLAELRIKQDLACFGYSEELQEKISTLIIDEQLDKIVGIFKRHTRETIEPSVIFDAINKYTLALPSTLSHFTMSPSPPPIDWNMRYGFAIEQPGYEKEYNINAIRHHVTKNFCKTIEIINRKEAFERHLELFFSLKNIPPDSFLGALFQRIDKELEEGPFPNNPFHLLELSLASFKKTPSFQGFKQAYEDILHGTLLAHLDAQCATDEYLQGIPFFLQSRYIHQLHQLAKGLSSDLEFTKIYWWVRYTPYKLYDKAIVQKFLETYGGNNISPSPQWLFRYSQHYKSEKKYRYERLNSFAFPFWQWKRMRKRFLTSLKVSTLIY